MKFEYAIQWLDGNGRWRQQNTHYTSQDEAQRKLDEQQASGPYPSGSPREPQRIVSRQVAARWKPVTAQE